MNLKLTIEHSTTCDSRINLIYMIRTIPYFCVWPLLIFVVYLDFSAKSCPTLGDEEVENAQILLAPRKTNFYFGDSVTVQCLLGYVVTGTMDTTKSLTCMADGSWDADLPICEG